MSGIGEFVLGGMAGRLVPALQTPVEDIIYEVLDQRGMPTRAEVRDLKNRLEKLEGTITDLTTAIEGLRKELVAGQAAIDAARAVAGSAPSAASAVGSMDDRSASLGDSSARSCKVGDCDGPLRARGFCAKHYQQWKRGNLEGVVSPDGTTVDGAVRYRVDVEAAGQLVQTRYDGDEVIFFLPESGGRTLRARVDAVRVEERPPGMGG